MMSWEDYLTKVISTFRKEFEKLSSEDQKHIRKKAYDDLPLKPCQVEVLDFGIDKKVVFFLAHDKGLPDMMFKTHKEAKNAEESEFAKKYEFMLFQHPLLDEAGWQKTFPMHRLFIYTKYSMRFKEMMSSQELAQYFLSDATKELKNKQVQVIKQSTDELKKTIAKIPEKKVRDELLANTRKIDSSWREIKRLDEEVLKVRKLVGATKEIQDWKLLISDVDRLKGEHVPREIFDTEVRRIDEKIDKGLKALNTRIEDLKAIKFWSKRTLLEIALAIMTVIAALYGAGVIKF